MINDVSVENKVKGVFLMMRLLKMNRVGEMMVVDVAC